MRRQGCLAAWAAGLLLVSSGCNGPLSPQAQELLLAGVDAYKRGDDKEAVGKLDEFLKDNAKSQAAGQAFYMRGLARYRLKDYPSAKVDLLDALNRGPGEELRAKSAAALGDLAYDTEDVPVAETMYRRAMDGLKKDQPPADQVYYRLGCTLQRLGRWTEADQQFDRLIYLFEGTEFARRAARLTHATVWTVQAGALRDRQRADAAARSLQAKGLQASVAMVLDGGQAVFAVRVGRYADYEQARSDLPKVKPYSSDAYVTPTR